MTQRLTVYSIGELVTMYSANQLVFRKIETPHSKKIKKYILDNYESGQLFLPPIVASLNDDQLYVIDGNARLRAIFEIIPQIEKLLLSEEEEKFKLGLKLETSLLQTRLAFQLFENLTEQSIDQMYVDLNTKGKKVALSKRIAYDSRNLVNVVTNDLLKQQTGLIIAGIEQDKVSLMRPKNTKFLSLSQLRIVVSLFIAGKERVTDIQANELNPNQITKRLALMNAWLEELFILESPQVIGNYEISILANFTVIRGLVYYALEGEQAIKEEDKERYIRERMKNLSHISWESRQPLWEQFDGKYRSRSQLYIIESSKNTVLKVKQWLIREGGDRHVKKG